MQSYDLENAERSRPAEESRLRRVLKKYERAFRAGKFAAGSAIGFLDTEIILVLGTYLLYGKLSPPQAANSSPYFWALNAIAFAAGVTVAFFVNEMLISRSQAGSFARPSLWNTIQRLVKFQLIFLTGNVIIIIVQLLLLREFGIAPYVGNIIGAIVSFPASYFFSMHFVWNPNTSPPRTKPVQRKLTGKIRGGSKSTKDYERQIARQFPRFTNDNVDIEVHEYRLDVTHPFENTVAIHFSLKLDVTPKKLESAKKVISDR